MSRIIGCDAKRDCEPLGKIRVGRVWSIYVAKGNLSVVNKNEVGTTLQGKQAGRSCRIERWGRRAMELLAKRIRRARTGAQLTQTQLAEAVGVQRSAVAQWEATSGTRPRVEHLMELAIRTSVNFEWLATGRGPSRIDSAELTETAILGDFADNEHESRMLELMRRLPPRKQDMACEMVELLATR